MVLVIEVIYLRELNLFYEVLPLLLIPLIIKGYFGILNFHTEEVIRSYEKYFSFYYDKETETIHITIKHLTDQSEISIQEKILKHEEENDQHLEKSLEFLL
jgi:hypothetical protein